MEKIKLLKVIKLYDMYGHPEEDREKVQSFLEPYVLPFPLYYNKHKLKVIRTHRYIGPAVIESLEEIKDYYGEKFLHEKGLDKYGECYNVRKTSPNKDVFSIHSWGLAIDFNFMLDNPGEASLMPYHFVNAFKKRGFQWGGDWMYCKESMHFTSVFEELTL